MTTKGGLNTTSCPLIADTPSTGTLAQLNSHRCPRSPGITVRNRRFPQKRRSSQLARHRPGRCPPTVDRGARTATLESRSAFSGCASTRDYRGASPSGFSSGLSNAPSLSHGM